MPIDISLIRHTLAVLRALSGASLPEETLAAEIEIRAGRSLTTQAVKDALLFVRDKGWAESRKDLFGREAWWITPTGINASTTGIG